MRQAGTVAYMSDRRQRESAEATYNWTPGSPASTDRTAVREARAILADREPIAHDPKRSWETAYASCWYVNVARRSWARMADDSDAGAALAQSLAAVLPVLDELEADAHHPVTCTRGCCR